MQSLSLPHSVTKSSGQSASQVIGREPMLPYKALTMITGMHLSLASGLNEAESCVLI